MRLSMQGRQQCCKLNAGIVIQVVQILDFRGMFFVLFKCSAAVCCLALGR
jgi:hypothetical protein